MKIAIAADHRGFGLKEILKKYLEKKYQIEDFGTNSSESVDYPDIAIPALESVIKKKNKKAILICGSGIGMSIIANKIKSIRAALIYNEKVALTAKKHNNANVVCLGADYIKPYQAKKCIKQWLRAKYEGGRHNKRLAKIKKLEEQK